MGLGVPELIVVLLLVVIFFGASRLPLIGKGLGEGIMNFKKGLGKSAELPSAAEDDSPDSEG